MWSVPYRFIIYDSADIVDRKPLYLRKKLSLLTVIQCENMKDTDQDLAEKQPVHISADSHKRNGKQYEGDPEKDPGGIVEKAGACFPQAVENAGQSGIHIQERTDKRHGADVSSSSRTVKKNFSRQRSQKEKAKGADSAQKKTSCTGLRGDAADPFPAA